MVSTYKVWVVSGVVDGDCDIETRYISVDDVDILDVVKGMDDVVGWFRVGVGVSEGVERTPSPTLSAPLIFEIPL